MGLLRLWLAFEVLRSHATPMGNAWMPVGQAAVEAFFVLSGFAMSMVLEQKYGQDRRRFWTQRFIKLWPSYAMAALLCLAYESWLRLAKNTGAGLMTELAAAPSPSWQAWLLLGFSNLSLIGQDLLALLCLEPGSGALRAISNPFLHPFPASHFVVLPQAWSLSVEVSFYALAPWYVRLSSRALVGIFILGILLRWGLVASGLPMDPWAFRLAPVELSTFSIGILSWRVFRSGAWQRPGLPPWLGSLSAWALILAAPMASTNPLLQSLAMALSSALALPWIFGAAKSQGWDRMLGDWAYPYYLLHILVALIGMDIAQTWSLTPRFWVLAPGCLLASALFWLAMRPPLAMLQRRLLVG
jgi:peptidoglycan/LPS O-acetylase OafA/YrhL